MADRARERHVKEMRRLQEAISRTTSKSLVRDYVKALKKMVRDLEEYDRYKAETKAEKPGRRFWEIITRKSRPWSTSLSRPRMRHGQGSMAEKKKERQISAGCTRSYRGRSTERQNKIKKNDPGFLTEAGAFFFIPQSFF